ncbi:GNAT family N-acetyltransferase [Roseivivax sp. CAU 1753]
MLTTDRLTLRPFAPSDRDEFVAINRDRRVMRHFPRPCTAAETDALLARFAEKLESDGHGFCAIERHRDHRMIGMCGLSRLDADLPFAPAIEIGWRLAPDAWGQGYASEAARAWLRHGFETCNLAQIVAFAPAINTASRRVMDRIGMARDPSGDFRHPDIPRASPLLPMVLYRITLADWQHATAET